MRSVVAIAILSSSLLWTEGQSTLTNTYDAKARAALVREATRVSTILSDAGVLPKETFTNATITYRGRAAQPSAEVRANICSYEFRRGALSWIDRKDLFVDKGPESLILLHLTSDRLTLTTNQAAVRALEIIEHMGFDMPSIRKNYTISVKEDLMIASPIRNGGPNFPPDLHFFGELRSRHKIKLSVDLIPVSISEQHPYVDFRIEFLATTGELLSGRFPDPELFAYYGVPSRERMTITNASDFTPPVCVTVITNSSNTQKIPASEAVDLFNVATRQLQKEIGPNKANAYLLIDNLNSPGALAAQMHQFARGIPWAGLSQPWMEDVPFDGPKLENITRRQRGLALMAICDVAVQFEVMTNVETMPFQGNDEESRKAYLRQRDAMEPDVAKFMERFQTAPTLPDDVICFIAPYNSRAFQTIVYLAGRSAMKNGKFVIETPGNGPEESGLEYFNGHVLTNAIVALSLGGNFPLEHDVQSLLRRQPEKRIPAASVYKPVQDFAQSLGRHPLHGMIHVIGAQNIRALQTAQSVEVLRLNPIRVERSDASIARINGHEILSTKLLGADAARQLAAVALDFSHTNHYSYQDPALMLITRDAWKPIVAFRVPNVPITFVSAFGHNATQILRPDSPPASFYFSFGLAKIALQAFPADTELQERSSAPKLPH